MPRKEDVFSFNWTHLAGSGLPVLKVKAKHSSAEAEKASEEDAEGLAPQVLLSEGATVMITRNLWTAKGK